MFARTRHLLLRPLWPGDATPLAHGLNDRQIARLLPDVPYPYRRADAVFAIEREAGRVPPLPHFAMIAVDEPGQPLVGGIGLGRDALPLPGDDADLWFWVAAPYQRQGFATEALTAVLELGFWGHHLSAISAILTAEARAAVTLLEQRFSFAEAGAVGMWSEAHQAGVAARRLRLTRARWEARRHCRAQPAALVA